MSRRLLSTHKQHNMQPSGGHVDEIWLAEVRRLLHVTDRIRYWRGVIWDVMYDQIYQRVHSFAELATALYSFSSSGAYAGPLGPVRGPKVSPSLAAFLRTARPDDEMRAFLLSALEYPTSFAEGNMEAPVAIIRAMHDIERIAQIEETSLSPRQQDVVRWPVLQIGRLAGENG